jgi:hypothetical protein
VDVIRGKTFCKTSWVGKRRIDEVVGGRWAFKALWMSFLKRFGFD